MVFLIFTAKRKRESSYGSPQAGPDGSQTPARGDNEPKNTRLAGPSPPAARAKHSVLPLVSWTLHPPPGS